MDGVMSQEEINALLNGSEDSSEQPKEEVRRVQLRHPMRMR